MKRTEQEIVIVTGGAGGIGAAIAEECGRRGDFVITLDPVVEVDGSPRTETTERTTAERIVEAGGHARASGASVTDALAVRELLTGLVDEFGGVDAIINVAGISRPTGFGHGTEDDWSSVIDVHLGGYLTILREALPIFAASGRGRIVGVTSGSGWRAADAGAYSCAKRVVASLTWQLGRAAPAGVTVNALSPIAATRMVAGALARSSKKPKGGPKKDATGGVRLDAVLPADTLGPVGAHLASREFAWCSGQVLFSNGAEISVVAPPHLIESIRTSDVPSIAGLLDLAGPVALATAGAKQTAGGGGIPRLGDGFKAAAPTTTQSKRCLLVSDDRSWREATRRELEGRGVAVIDGDPGAVDFAGVAQAVDTVDEPLDAVVVALLGEGASPTTNTDGGWQSILEAHAGIENAIQRDAAWVRAAAQRSAREQEPVRVITLTAADSPGGRSRAMAAAQLARAAQGSSDGRVSAFSIAIESTAPTAHAGATALVGHLILDAEAQALSGVELVADAHWVGLRSHPSVRGTISYGGPELPEWIDDALRRMVHGEFHNDD